jgi:hypothetical protein
MPWYFWLFIAICGACVLVLLVFVIFLGYMLKHSGEGRGEPWEMTS